MLREAPLAKQTAAATAAASLGLNASNGGTAPFSPFSPKAGPRSPGVPASAAHQQWAERRKEKAGAAEEHSIFQSLDDDGSSQWEGF
jgi:hypothetical protein